MHKDTSWIIFHESRPTIVVKPCLPTETCRPEIGPRSASISPLISTRSARVTKTFYSSSPILAVPSAHLSPCVSSFRVPAAKSAGAHGVAIRKPLSVGHARVLIVQPNVRTEGLNSRGVSTPSVDGVDGCPAIRCTDPQPPLNSSGRSSCLIYSRWRGAIIVPTGRPLFRFRVWTATWKPARGKKPRRSRTEDVAGRCAAKLTVNDLRLAMGKWNGLRRLRTLFRDFSTVLLCLFGSIEDCLLLGCGGCSSILGEIVLGLLDSFFEWWLDWELV